MLPGTCGKRGMGFVGDEMSESSLLSSNIFYNQYLQSNSIRYCIAVRGGAPEKPFNFIGYVHFTMLTKSIYAALQ